MPYRLSINENTTAALPQEILRLIMSYAKVNNDMASIIKFGSISPACLEISIPETGTALFSELNNNIWTHEEISELIREPDVTAFMRKFYSIQANRPAVSIEVLAQKSLECYKILSIINEINLDHSHPAFHYEINGKRQNLLLTSHELEKENENRILQTQYLPLNLFIHLPALFFMATLETIASFSSHLPFNYNRIYVKIPALIYLPSYNQLIKFMSDDLALPSYKITTPDNPNEPLQYRKPSLLLRTQYYQPKNEVEKSYILWMQQLGKELQTGKSEFLSLPNMNQRPNPHLNQALNGLNFILSAYCFIFHPLPFVPHCAEMVLWKNKLYASEADELISQMYGKHNRHHDRVSNGSLAILLMACIGMLLDPIKLKPMIEDNTYNTPTYTYINSYIALMNTLMVVGCVMLHLAPKVKSTAQGVYHSWRRNNEPAAINLNEIDIEALNINTETRGLLANQSNGNS